MKYRLLLYFTLFSLSASAQSTWPDSLNTAKDAPYLSPLEKEVLLEMNKVRSNPKRYAEEYIKELKKSFSGKDMTWPGEGIITSTQEGITAVDECYRALLSKKPAPLLRPSKGMSKAAKEHAQYQEKSGNLGHTGAKGSDPEQRLKEHGTWEITLGENISYGCTSASKIVCSLLIDDGISNRGHRENTLNPTFRVAGIAFAPHPKYDGTCVIDLAGGFIEKK